MKDKIYTLAEMKEANILTEHYEPIHAPEIVIGTLEMKARCKDKYQLRIFLSLSDGRKIITPVFWWQKYCGFYEIPVGTVLRLTYAEGKNGMFYLEKAEAV